MYYELRKRDTSVPTARWEELMAKTDPARRRRGPVPSLRVISGGQGAESDGKRSSARGANVTGKGKRGQFDLETWHALDMLARNQMKTFQELSDEAFDGRSDQQGQPAN